MQAERIINLYQKVERKTEYLPLFLLAMKLFDKGAKELFREGILEKDNKLHNIITGKLAIDQSKKDFKDTEYVDFPAKYRRNFNRIYLDQLDDIEKDPIFAYSQITKDKVWIKESPEELKAEKNSSGAAYIKIKIRESLASKPPDSPLHRKVYVATVQKIQELLAEATNVSICKDILRDKFEPWFNDFIKEYPTIHKQPTTYINYRFKDAKDVFGASFINIVRAYGSDAASQHWGQAKYYEPAVLYNTQTELDEKIKIFKNKLKYCEDFINDLASLSETASDVSNAPDRQAASAAIIMRINAIYTEHMDKNPNDINLWRHVGGTIEWAKKSFGLPSIVIKQAINTMRKYTDSFNNKIAEYSREEDWSWADIKKEKSGKENSKDRQRFPKHNEPLKHIVRVGGKSVTEDIIRVENIKNIFGYKNIVFGNYMGNDISKKSVQHYIESMFDLQDALNLDLKAINEYSGLTIAFGAIGGSGGAKAFYKPDRKAINLTKGNGDGSVAHEWGHYLDNIMMEGKKQVATNWKFATENIGVFKDFIENLKLSDPRKTQLYVECIKQKRLYIIAVYRDAYYNSKSAEEALRVFDGMVLSPKDISWAKDFLNALCVKYKLPSIKAEITTTMSVFYQNALYWDEAEGKKYWSTPTEMFARAVQCITDYRLRKLGRSNNYLVSYPKGDRSPYLADPKEQERASALIEPVLEYVRTFISGKQLEGLSDANVATKEAWEMTQVEFYRDKSIKIETSIDRGNNDKGKPLFVYQTVVPYSNNRGDKKMMFREYLKHQNIHQAAEKLHKRIIEQALADGKPVPAEVLKDYPELQPNVNPKKKPPLKKRYASLVWLIVKKTHENRQNYKGNEVKPEYVKCLQIAGKLIGIDFWRMRWGMAKKLQNKSTRSVNQELKILNIDNELSGLNVLEKMIEEAKI